MNRNLVGTAAAALILASSVAPVAASSPNANANAYAGASWYQKYLVVSADVTLPCTGNSGSAPQLTFDTNVDASHECGSQSETSIAINPHDPLNVIAGSNEIQRLPMRAMFSTDGGTNFTGVDLPLPPARTNNGFDFGSDPGVAFDSEGNAYYSYIVVFFGAGGGINGTAMAVAHSTDHGATWTATFFAPETGSGQFNDKPMITVDTGTAHHNRVYVAWDHASGSSSSTKNGNNVLLSWSDDGGVTFSTPVSASGNVTGKTGGIGADPYVTPNGTLHVAWQDYTHGAILDAASTDGGLTFSAPVRIAPVAAFEFAVAAQRSRGALVYPACGATPTALYCAYMDGSNAATTVSVAKSTDGGQHWASTAMPGNGDQFNQWLAVDPIDGSVNVAYYDTGTHGATSTRYTLARSIDEGGSYTTTQVATATTDESCCASTGVDSGNQYGDYEGVAAFGGLVRPVWTDRRQGVIDLALREEVLTTAMSFLAP